MEPFCETGERQLASFSVVERQVATTDAASQGAMIHTKHADFHILRHTPCPFFLGVFVSLVFFLLQNSLVFLSVFCLFSGLLKVHTARRILGVFEVFLGIFEKTKEKKDNGNHHKKNGNKKPRA